MLPTLGNKTLRHLALFLSNSCVILIEIVRCKFAIEIARWKWWTCKSLDRLLLETTRCDLWLHNTSTANIRSLKQVRCQTHCVGKSNYGTSTDIRQGWTILKNCMAQKQRSGSLNCTTPGITHRIRHPRRIVLSVRHAVMALRREPGKDPWYP